MENPVGYCQPAISSSWDPAARAVLLLGDNMQILPTLPRESIQLIITSPPYNVGKEYETRVSIDEYLEVQARVIDLCAPLLAPAGSICWQTGNHITSRGEVVPLDVLLFPMFKKHGLVMRNRIVWHFGHGLHARRRFSGRYETIMWFTRGKHYYFDLDEVRVAQKYPGKRHFKGDKRGQYSGNPMGKNPGDVWDIPNVKAKHIEKTIHPCQFPVALVQRLVRGLAPQDTWVLDPYMGVGSTVCAAVLEGRRGVGCEIREDYYQLADERVRLACQGQLRIRPLDRPVYVPNPTSPLLVRDDDDAVNPLASA